MDLKAANNIRWSPEVYLKTKQAVMTKSPYSVPENIRKIFGDLRVNSDTLFYEGLQVIPSDQIDNILARAYDDPVVGANSRDHMYRVVTEKYIGISRRRVQDWLRNQESYQIHLVQPKASTVKPIVTTRVNERWQVDLIDLGDDLSWFSHGFRYVLMVIDTTSKFVYARALKTKVAGEVAQGMDDILIKADGKPGVIQTDRGSEFKTEFDVILAKHGVRHVLSQAHNPTSQAQVECTNGTIKRWLFASMTKYNTKDWATLLPSIIEMYNNHFHGTIKDKPISVMTSKDGSKAAKLIQEKATRTMAHQRSLPPLQVGDTVRLRMSRVNPQTAIFKKSYTAAWSPRLFTVERVYRTNPQSYAIKDSPVDRRWYRDDLQRIEPQALRTTQAMRGEREVLLDGLHERRRTGTYTTEYALPESTPREERLQVAQISDPVRRLQAELRPLMIGKWNDTLWRQVLYVHYPRQNWDYYRGSQLRLRIQDQILVPLFEKNEMPKLT